MTDKVFKQFLEKIRDENHKKEISVHNAELYRRFLMTCEDFKKMLVKCAGKEQTPEILESIDRIISAYSDCFFELAYCYFGEGHRRGLLFSLDYIHSK